MTTLGQGEKASIDKHSSLFFPSIMGIKKVYNFGNWLAVF
jgi:hypothetical protein